MTKKEFIRSLNPEDAFEVLLVVLNQNPDLEDTVYQIAKQVLCNITSDDIAVPFFINYMYFRVLRYSTHK